LYSYFNTAFIADIQIKLFGLIAHFDNYDEGILKAG